MSYERKRNKNQKQTKMLSWSKVLGCILLELSQNENTRKRIKMRSFGWHSNSRTNRILFRSFRPWRNETVYSEERNTDPFHVCGNAVNLEYRTIRLFYRIEHLFCFVLQIGCIPTDVRGVYRSKKCSFRKIHEFTIFFWLFSLPLISSQANSSHDWNRFRLTHSFAW